jgi:hypothetical protein
LAEWSRLFLDAGDKMGKTFRIADHAKDYLIAAGFVNVVEKKYKMPVGNWSTDPKFKTIGSYNLLFCVQGLEGFALFILSKILGVSSVTPRRNLHCSVAIVGIRRDPSIFRKGKGGFPE